METVDPTTANPALHLPVSAGLRGARLAAATCTACPLYAHATQTVFGEGAPRASLMLVGEQPGDREDLAGRPFVGPAGALLDRALEEAGIDRERTFVTNVVKHFKWRPSGKRRLHERPNAAEVRACRPWLDLELGIAEDRGRIVRALENGPPVLATFHPSAILRARTPEDRERMDAALIADLSTARESIAAH